MGQEKVRNILERAVADLPVEERTFPNIQNEAIISAGRDMLDEEVRISLVGDRRLYQLLKSLPDSYQVRLYAPEIIRALQVHKMPLRAVEVLGSGLNQLPSFYKRVKQAQAEVELFEVAERGFVYVIKIRDNLYVVKPLQGGDDECAIVPIASRTGIGPKLEEINEWWLAEEFVEAPSLDEANLQVNQVVDLLSHVYSTLHKNRIVYKDRFHDHLLLSKRGQILIDYGIAYFGDDFSPDISMINKFLKDTEAQKIFRKKYEIALAQPN